MQVLTEGVHSGDASGVVPSSFRILRSLLSRLEDEASGEIRPSDLHVQIPPGRIAEAKAAAAALGDEVYAKFPFVAGMRPVERRPGRAAPEPHLATGARDHRPRGRAGRRRRRQCAAALHRRQARRCACRRPLDAGKSRRQASRPLLETDPPYGAKVTFSPEQAAPGWNAPAMAPWLPPPSTAPRRPPSAGRGHDGRRRLDPVHGHAGREVPRRPSSSSPACSAPTPTPTAPTNSCTSAWARRSAWPWPRCWPITGRGTRAYRAGPLGLRNPSPREKGYSRRRILSDSSVPHHWARKSRLIAAGS